MSEENFVSPTDIKVASTEWEQAQFASSPEIATIDFETAIPENIVIEESQIVFEEPSVSCQEIETETDEIRTETNEHETRVTQTNSDKEDEKPLRAQRSKISEKILSYIKLMKYVAVLISKPRKNIEVVKELVQLVTVETKVQNTMENETQNVEKSEEVHPLDKHEKQHDYSNANENNEDLTPVFAQNAIQFSTPANNLSIEGNICGKKFSFLVDTGANVSAIKADVWKQLPPPTKHPPKPTNSIEELTNNKKFSFKTAEIEETDDENLVPNCVLAVLFLFIWRSIVSSSLHPILSKELRWLMRKHEREKSAVINY